VFIYVALLLSFWGEFIYFYNCDVNTNHLCHLLSFLMFEVVTGLKLNWSNQS
jgi:hypothetical protein